jgi:hypothetical protein
MLERKEENDNGDVRDRVILPFGHCGLLLGPFSFS